MNFSRVSQILKTVVNDQSSEETREIMIQLNVCHKHTENLENTKRVEDNFGSFHEVMRSWKAWKEWKTWSTICKNSAISTRNMENKSKRLCWSVESVANKNLHFRQCNCIKSHFSQCI